MASLRADDDPQASEYAGKDSPDDSDNDEGLYVETNVNVTKLLTTRGSRNSSTMDKPEHLPHKLHERQEDGPLPKEERNRLESLAEKLLDVLAITSEDGTEPVTQEVQETHLADESASKCPLEVEDGNRKTFLLTGHPDSPGSEFGAKLVQLFLTLSI